MPTDVIACLRETVGKSSSLSRTSGMMGWKFLRKVLGSSCHGADVLLNVRLSVGAGEMVEQIASCVLESS
jgi:hypothetical protein